MFLGNGVLPQASLVSPKMQKKLGNLIVADIIEANRIPNEPLRLEPVITFKRPYPVRKMKLVRLLDASHGGGN